ncbi:hypothetical protein [Aliiruegeria lutimaris]|uniref:hypothetical protein n=1 Tax=Aliiruegeria lutimaris TaxID=571298 RepID=UPI00147D98AE|nr:hypothetical protein [Aliiruegeria lutimaris]
MATGLDQLLLRHLGFFNVEPNSPGYMMRLRTPANILRTREPQGIPRKFSIAFDNAGSISCVSNTNDIGSLAVEVRANGQGVETAPIAARRAKAQLKYLLDDKGFEWLCARTQEKLDAFGTGVRLTPLAPAHDAPRPAIKRQGHIGVHPRKQPG